MAGVTRTLNPSPMLLAKLGSIIVHVEEMLSPKGHAFDKVALEQLMLDPDVREWLAEMDALAMVPRKR